MSDEISVPSDKPAHIQDRTKVEHDAPKDSPFNQLCAKFLELYEKKEALNAELKELNKELDGWDDTFTGEVHKGLCETIADMMETTGFDLVRLPGLASFWPKPENWPSVNKDETEAFCAWLDANGMGAIAKRTVHPQTLKGWANNMIKENKPLPKMVTMATKMKLGFRRMPTK